LVILIPVPRKRRSYAQVLVPREIHTGRVQEFVKEGGTARIEVAKKVLGSVGGSLEAFNYSCGEEDFYIIVNLPDRVSAMAVTLAGNISGTFNIRATELLTPKEVDEVVKKSIDFRPQDY
jgi:uncharacterized protein with GYD domain